MTATITLTILPQERKIAVPPSGNLLNLLIQHGILLRADCGGRGKCGKCAIEWQTAPATFTTRNACDCTVTGDTVIRIPPGSLLSAHILGKAEAILPPSFHQHCRNTTRKSGELGLAVDLGTTTLALYLCDLGQATILRSLSVKNPQALYGDDVMTRIGRIGGNDEKLKEMQQLAVGAIDWGIRELLDGSADSSCPPSQMVVVGNPAMIHILLGIDPGSIGIAPYLPQFYDSQRRDGAALGLGLPQATILTYPQLSGFLGGDILAAAIAAEIFNRPVGTLLVDLGTNGELLLKGRDGFYATSCATGPAFEGAAISCGVQAIPGAIDRIRLIDRNSPPSYTTIGQDRRRFAVPCGICGSGIISGIVALLAVGLIDASGRLTDDPQIEAIRTDGPGGRRYVVVPASNSLYGEEIAISQKDIRSVQLGKAALSSGIDMLLAAAGLTRPQQILVAGAFGSHIASADLQALGMLPPLPTENIHTIGNGAGAGAVMAVCDQSYLVQARHLAESTTVINLAADPQFQQLFIDRLNLTR